MRLVVRTIDEGFDWGSAAVGAGGAGAVLLRLVWRLRVRVARPHAGGAMTRPLTRALLTGAIAATALTAVVAPANAHRAVRSDAVIAWNANAGKAALAACISPSDDPLHESRLYAMTHVAIHDALNAIDRRSRPYASRPGEAGEPLWMPRWRRPRVTCWSRFSASFPLPSRRRASTRVSRASRPTT